MANLITTTIASAAFTATGNGTEIVIGPRSSLCLDISVTAVSGTGASCTFMLQRKGADGNWYTIYTSSAVTAIGTVSTTIGAGCSTNQDFGTSIRLAWTISGTTPSFTFGASIIGK